MLAASGGLTVNVLLVGEDPTSLRLLALDLSLRGVVVTTASDAEHLTRVLAMSTPDVIVFDHVEPLDVYLLNPRKPGFKGPLVLLIDQDLPAEMTSQLQPHHIARKPFQIETLYVEISRFTTAS